MKMIKIELGAFKMGSEGWGPFEIPVHEVKLDSFMLDETPVTNADFDQFVKETGFITEAEKAGASWGYKNGKYQLIAGQSWKSFVSIEREKHPVVLVSWNDATAFALWAGKRLPTEAEWEFAARGKETQLLYPWGDQEPVGKCNWNQLPSETPATSEIKSYEPNSFGLYDMVGNVWQWIADWYDPEYYKISSASNPLGPESGQFKVRRGASFNVIQPFRLRCANRGSYDPNSYSINIGFRCAKSI